MLTLGEGRAACSTNFSEGCSSSSVCGLQPALPLDCDLTIVLPLPLPAVLPAVLRLGLGGTCGPAHRTGLVRRSGQASSPLLRLSSLAPADCVCGCGWGWG